MYIHSRAFLGVWKLVSSNTYLVSDPTGPPIGQPIGDHPVGRIIFLPNGYMSIIGTSLEATAHINVTQLRNATDSEIVRIAKPMTTYSGRYHSYKRDGTDLLATNVSVALDPNFMEHLQERKWTVTTENGTTLLALQPTQNGTTWDGKKTFGVLVWEKEADV